jgi:flagellar hook-associated protein 1 FlgK
MSDLFATLDSASSAITAFQKAIDVTSNNVTNANTPGYAKQVPVFEALPFNLSNGLSGGVEAGQPQDTRSQFAESAVQQQTSLLGTFQQIQTSLQPLQTVFDATGNSGVSKALNDLYSAFSAWSTEPDNTSSRSAVIAAAGEVATAFQQGASQINSTLNSTNQDLQAKLNQINQAESAIVAYNTAKATDRTPDPGLDANLNSTLENLSQIVDVQVLHQPDGSVTVLLGGQTPLVIGQQANPLQLGFSVPAGSAFPGNPPVATILDQNGEDITSHVNSGNLAGLLSVRNGSLASLIGSPSQAGDLNTLAKGFADAVNATLAAGSTTTGLPAQPGPPLFVYSAGPNVAATITVNPAITPSQLAAVDPVSGVSNGTALALANLDSNSATFINGLSFSQFFSSLATRVGSQISSATTSAQVQTQAVSQAQAVRQQVSGVSLDEEATRLIQLQTAYQAASKVVTVIDELTQTLINMVQ